ncbi:MAG: hypothetical protein QOE24_1481 [Frankiales bacterium]|nr:hypothetical protein [Frankiales bacterium]MDX6223004.1 hypothetical protein [Frankiales bacterium]
MRLEGTLDAFSLPDIFQLLSFTKKTGGLHLRRGDVHGVVFFTAGSVTGASADQGRQALGRRLVGAGHVSDDALMQAVDRAAGDPGIGLAKALAEAGAADESVLTSLMAEQAVDSVFDLLRWPEGDFGFVVDEANPDDLGVALPVDDVVAEARRRLDYWQTVSRTIPSPDSVLVISAHAPADLSINADEWSMLGLVDGRRGVHELIALTGRGEFTCVSALAAMVDRGLLAVRGGDDGDAASALIRRHLVLSRLESGAPVSSSSLAAAVSGTSEPAPVEQHAAFAQQGSAPASGATMLSTTPVAETPARPEDRNVTPARPEPFLPRRTPDHPEDHVPASTMNTVNGLGSHAGGGSVVGSSAVAAAVAPASSPYIERDPSVNKSLLLRLIAGVRGL